MEKEQFVQLVLEAVVKAYEQRNTLKNQTFFKTWLVRIVMNECYQILRKRKRRMSMDEKLLKDDRKLSVYVREDYLDLYRAIAALKEKDRICILLFYMEDFTIKQIADTLEIPTGTVKSRLNRAREQLKGMLG